MTTCVRTWLGVLSVLAVLATFGAASSAEAAKATDMQTASAVVATDPVNINTAGVKELMTLDGIGQKTAEKIVEYRAGHGLFKKPEEIRKVDGIGAGLWKRNRDRITVK